ncbi:MAG TPA: alpha/beta hydrolase, partial [bacterium]
MGIRRWVCAAWVLLALAGGAQAQLDWAKQPVKVMADQALPVIDGSASGQARLFVLQDWSQPLPQVKRAVVVIPGVDRAADIGRQALAQLVAQGPAPASETLGIVIQFPILADVKAHKLPAATLYWDVFGWAVGTQSEGPASVSAFAVVDAVLARLADPARFPALQQVVVAGHSAGGQFVQRYAVVVRGEAPLLARGIAVRYVVANPSSYLYFDTQRPSGDGFAAFNGAACPQFNRYRFGLENLPRYAEGEDVSGLEAAYLKRRVIYLLGTEDSNPHHPALDRSCMAEAQGPHRFARGQAYMRYLRARHPDFTPAVWPVRGVGHQE